MILARRNVLAQYLKETHPNARAQMSTNFVVLDFPGRSRCEVSLTASPRIGSNVHFSFDATHLPELTKICEYIDKLARDE